MIKNIKKTKKRPGNAILFKAGPLSLPWLTDDEGTTQGRTCLSMATCAATFLIPYLCLSSKPNCYNNPGEGVVDCLTLVVHIHGVFTSFPHSLALRYHMEMAADVLSHDDPPSRHQQAGLAQLGERQTEVHFRQSSQSGGHVFDPHKPHSPAQSSGFFFPFPFFVVFCGRYLLAVMMFC